MAPVLLLLASLAPQLASAQVVSEAKLKAAFVYNFTKFIEWPAARFDDVHAPIVIGLLAEDTFEAELAAIVANRQVNGRALLVRHVASPADLQSVHLVFVSMERESRFIALRDKAPLSAVLVIGDEQSCRSFGGGICFVQQGEKLRFEINMDETERSHLKISAQLQKLAVAVNKGE